MSRTITCMICGQHRWDNEDHCSCGYDDSIDEDFERYEADMEYERKIAKGDILRDEERDRLAEDEHRALNDHFKPREE